MRYIKTIYNNPRQINMANLNKIENKLEELDQNIEELKLKTETISTETVESNTKVINGIDAPKITDITVNSIDLKKGETGYNFNFTFIFDSGDSITTNTVNLPITEAK